MKFIFVVKMKHGKSEQDYVEAWQRGSEIIQSSSGAQGTVLYRNIEKPNQLLAVATWESQKARDQAMEKLEKVALEVHQVLKKHRQFGDIDVLGYFEEIARVEK